MFRPLRPVFVIFLIFAAVMAASQWLGPHDRVPWKNDLAIAQADARAAKKPVLAYFTAEWCGPCQEMKKTTWADRDVVHAIEQAYVPVKIDIERSPELRARYHADTIPMLAVLDDQGNVVRSITGAQEPADMLEWLRGKSN